MLVYLFFCILSCLLGYFARGKNKALLMFLAMLPPFFVSSLRYDNGSDYLMYENIFNSIRDYGYYDSVKPLEVGFSYLINFSIFLSDNSFFFFAIVAFVILSFYFIGIAKISKNITISILLFFISGTFFDTFNGLRQYIAAAISFFSFYYIIENSYKKYIISILFASLFHYTALVMLPLFWIVKRNYSIKLIILVIAFFTFGSLLINRLFYLLLGYTRYSFYLDSEELVVVPTISTILYTSIIGLLGLYFYNLYKKEELLSERFIILFNIQIIAWITSLLSLSIPLALRWQYYFVPVSILFIPEILSISKYKFNRLFIITALFLIYTTTLVYGMLYNGWFAAYPYNTINF